MSRACRLNHLARGQASVGYGRGELPLGATNELTPGEADRLWILDVAGQRVVIEAAETPGQAAATAEVQAVLDSLKLTPLPSPLTLAMTAGPKPW